MCHSSLLCKIFREIGHRPERGIALRFVHEESCRGFSGMARMEAGQEWRCGGSGGYSGFSAERNTGPADFVRRSGGSIGLPLLRGWLRPAGLREER